MVEPVEAISSSREAGRMRRIKGHDPGCVYKRAIHRSRMVHQARIEETDKKAENELTGMRQCEVRKNSSVQCPSSIAAGLPTDVNEWESTTNGASWAMKRPTKQSTATRETRKIPHAPPSSRNRPKIPKRADRNMMATYPLFFIRQRFLPGTCSRKSATSAPSGEVRSIGYLASGVVMRGA